MNRCKAFMTAVTLVAVVLLTGLGSTTVAAEAADANLIFFHHSVGSNWLSSGLCAALNASSYHVADTNYGWPYDGRDFGGSTDTVDWPTWFTDSPSTIMDLAYAEMNLSSGSNTIAPVAGENTIVMFKSCYPNSEIPRTIEEEKAIYSSLLPYFEAHPDKMFVLVTPPPMQYITNVYRTRAVCEWLTDRDTGWLKDLATGNVFAFDLYNVLTHPEAHHRMVSGVEVHEVVTGADTLYSAYHTGDDNHPNNNGNAKATTEFVPLLNAWYEEFLAASGSAPRRYQQSDAHLTYLGSWQYLATGAASGGSLGYTNVKGAAVLVSFTGTSVELLGLKGPNYGRALISLDDDPAVSYDLYSPNPSHQQTIYKAEGLDDTTHTLTISCAGEKSGASSGHYISLDAVRVAGALTQAPTPARLQQEEPEFAYTGTWITNWGSWALYSGGSFKSADAPGSSLNISFSGTYLAWVARTAPWYGKALVSVDGGPSVAVDLYSSSVKYKQKVFDTGLLGAGPHTVSIYWSGDKRWAAGGTTIVVDALDILGTLSDADPAPPLEWRYQQSDPRITYLGTWARTATWQASGGSFYSTIMVSPVSAHSQALAHFTGTSVKLVARTAPWCGRAVVFVDGESEVVDFYSGSLAYKQVVFEKVGLSPGPHTLTIESQESRSGLSSGYSISVDALDIVGYLHQGPVVTRVQENDEAWIAEGHIATEGVWSSHVGSWWSHSGAGLMTANSAAAKMTVTFDGSYLAWVAKTTPWYGRARVTLDPGTPGEQITTVDLYSPTQGYKRTVYRTGLLAEGSHTVVIEWLGAKYWRSSGTTISADAFDMILAP